MTLQVNIDVPDLARGVAFYEQAFGLTLARRLFDGKVAELSGGPCPFFLLEKDAGPGAAPGAPVAARRDYARHWTPVHLELLVPAIGPAVARAVAAGARLEGEIATLVWGKLAVLADPFGHGFCLIELVGRGYAEVEEEGAPWARP